MRLVCVAGSPADGCIGFGPGVGEIDFVEDFALSTDRTVPLKQLIPGTEDYYYYHCPALPQHRAVRQGRAARSTPWVQRHGQTPRVCRDPDPPGPADLRQEPAEVARLPAEPARPAVPPPEGRAQRRAEPADRRSIRPSSPARRSSTGRVAVNPNNLDGFEDAALDWLIAAELNADQRRQPAVAAAAARLSEPGEADRRRPQSPELRRLRLARHPPADARSRSSTSC